MIPGFREFEFDLPDALLSHLAQAFDNMTGARLSPSNVGLIPEAQGVYQLSLSDHIVYVGKTDAEAGLKRRLQRHAWTIQHRKNLRPEDVSFKALRVFVFTAIDLETQLIHQYRRKGVVGWNNSGFGSNDPGRERDTTKAKPKGFDALYPVDFDRRVVLDVLDPLTAASVFTALKKVLPYTLRVQLASDRKKKFHPDIEACVVRLAGKTVTARSSIETVFKHMPPGWQATGLAGRVIIYKENREYPFGEVIARS